MSVWLRSFAWHGAARIRHVRRCRPTPASTTASSSVIFGTASAPGTCGPATRGAPACGSGVATLGNQSGTDQAAGNPINLINGNKYQREDDLPALPGVLGLEIVRHYNSSYANPQARPDILSTALQKWIDKNPTASSGDRAAAENVLRDLQNALKGQ